MAPGPASLHGLTGVIDPQLHFVLSESWVSTNLDNWQSPPGNRDQQTARRGDGRLLIPLPVLLCSIKC